MAYILPALSVILVFVFLIVILRKGRERRVISLTEFRREQGIDERRSRVKAQNGRSGSR